MTSPRINAINAYAIGVANETVGAMSDADLADYYACPAGWADRLSILIDEAFDDDEIAERDREEIKRKYLVLADGIAILEAEKGLVFR